MLRLTSSHSLSFGCRVPLYRSAWQCRGFSAANEADWRPWKEPEIKQLAWERFQLSGQAVRKEWRQFVQLHPNNSTECQETQTEFFEFMDKRHAGARALAQNMSTCSDLRSPHEWYPIARQLQRRIIFHAGPTNSGKTHQALEAVGRSASSVYCAPLRLLAAEVFQNMSNRPELDGTVGLLTGDDRRGEIDASHVSCTVEMAPLGRVREVAVLDEIQLLAEPRRGWAWTRALLGLPAHEVHICGSISALPAIERLLTTTGEPLEVNEYERMSPLVVSAQSLKGRLAATRPGDAVVAFSRRELFALRHQLETKHNKSVAMVYGSLPPENRAEQVERFNSGAAEVLVASDAIGMGLNLNIQRVIFSKMEKYNGERVGPIDPASVLQIAGRAGRFNFSGGAGGECLTLHNRDMSALRHAMRNGPADVLTSGLLPSWEQLELFAQNAEQMAKHELSLSELLLTFEKYATVDTAHFMCDTDEQRAVAEMTEHIPLDKYDAFTFSIAPSDTKNPFVARQLIKYAKLHVAGETVPVPRMASIHHNLKELESQHKVSSLWLWLSYRYPESFPEREECLQVQAACRELITIQLEEMAKQARPEWVEF